MVHMCRGKVTDVLERELSMLVKHPDLAPSKPVSHCMLQHER